MGKMNVLSGFIIPLILQPVSEALVAERLVHQPALVRPCPLHLVTGI